MFLEYGLNAANELIHIGQVGRGRTPLTCPWCGIPLVAKKGDIKAAHFAHDGPTCAASVSDQVRLPAYDCFDLHLPPKVYADLKAFVGEGKSLRRFGISYEELRAYDLIIYNDYTREDELTKHGKIPLGRLSLKLFAEYQENAFLEKHQALEDEAHEAIETSDFAATLTDLRIYRAQWRRLLQSTLYFLEVNYAGGRLYKIGVTTRAIETRLAEIERDVYPHIGATTLRVLETRPYRGSIELYFKHRYHAFQHPLGTLGEYFAFPDIKSVLTYDLRRMPKKTLTPFEHDLWAGARSPLEQQLDAKAIEARRRERIKDGMQRAKAKGRVVGRPAGSTKVRDEANLRAYLAKPHNVRIAALLEQGGTSIRVIAEMCRVSAGTVQKVKTALATLNHLPTE